MKPPRWIFVAALTLTARAGEMRLWTNTSGNLVEAEMVGVNAARRAVKVRLKDGTEAEILIESLSPPDKEYARAEWERLQSAPAETPAAVPGVNLAALPNRYVCRLTSDARLKKIIEGGGTAEVESAILKSLQQFKSSQNPDGSWGRANKAALTGFALQCFLGHGDTMNSAEFGDSVIKGLMFLTELTKKNPHGMLSEVWAAGKGGAGTYEHAIATTALCEAYLFARAGGRQLPGQRECLEKAVDLIIAQQNKAGSWNYGGKVDIAYYAESTGGDLSLANWHFLALDAAKSTQLSFKGLDSCMKKASDYIESTQTTDGGFGGKSREAHYNQWSLSGGACTGHVLLTGKSSSSSQKAIKFLTNFLTAEPPAWDTNCNPYCWHGYTHALYLHGGPEWQSYAKLVMPQIIAAQESDGGFKRGRANWPAGDASDATYRQALCTLILETFYRCAQ